MSTPIKPTVGRIVLVFFAPAASGVMEGYAFPTTADTPVPGLIAHVHDDGRINVAAFDAHGANLPLTNVRLRQDFEDRPASGCWAEWMPYQIEQAKKAEDRERDTKQLAVAADRASDDRRMRAGVLDMAMRTPGLGSHYDVLKAAEAYQAHIEGGGESQLSDGQILETFQYQLSIDGGDVDRAAINTVRVLRGEPAPIRGIPRDTGTETASQTDAAYAAMRRMAIQTSPVAAQIIGASKSET